MCGPGSSKQVQLVAKWLLLTIVGSTMSRVLLPASHVGTFSHIAGAREVISITSHATKSHHGLIPVGIFANILQRIKAAFESDPLT